MIEDKIIVQTTLIRVKDNGTSVEKLTRII